MKPRVLLDVDGVIADFLGPSLRFIEREFGASYDATTFPTWDLFETVDLRYRAATEAEWMREGWCLAIPPYPGAQESVARLREVADVYFVTAQLPNARHWMWERLQWLKTHFEADERHVVLTHCKYLVEGEVLVDDKLANVNAWAAAHPTKKGALWTAPYNLRSEPTGNVKRCGGWDEVLALL